MPPSAIASSSDRPLSLASRPLSTAFAVTTLVWGCFKVWKVAQIKIIFIPTLVRDSKCNRKATFLPPRFEDDKDLSAFNSSPSVFGWIESFYAEPARNDHGVLFGVSGVAVPELYRNSIKFHTWLVVSQIVFWGTRIVALDEIQTWSYLSEPSLDYMML